MHATIVIPYVCYPSRPSTDGREGERRLETSELRGRIRSTASDKLGNNCCHSQMRAATTSAEYACLLGRRDTRRKARKGTQARCTCTERSAAAVYADIPKSFVKHARKAASVQHAMTFIPFATNLFARVIIPEIYVISQEAQKKQYNISQNIYGKSKYVKLFFFSGKKTRTC